MSTTSILVMMAGIWSVFFLGYWIWFRWMKIVKRNVTWGMMKTFWGLIGIEIILVLVAVIYFAINR